MMNIRYTIVVAVALLLGMGGCSSDFLEQKPQGKLIDEQLNNTKAVEWLLTGAYGLMNGNRDGTWGNYAAAPSQWLFGDVAGGDAHKGSEAADQATMFDIEQHTAIPVNEHLSTMWNNYYEGINRCNTTLRRLKLVQETAEETFSDERATEIEAEARMLRGHYYFFLWRVFRNIPYVDETLSTEEAAQTPNNVDVLPFIEADFRFAADHLTNTPPMGDEGRVDGIAAKAYLGKLYLYEQKYAEALALFKDVIADRPDLQTLPFLDNFNINTENGPEAIFSAQHAINPNGSGDNANVGDMLSGLYGSAPVNCCGFFNPSFDLVNAFRVTGEGLPMLDGDFRNDPYTSDFGLTGDAQENYQVDQSLAVDPRLDYTVGRRGVPYHDWGIMPGNEWMRDPAFHGPFVSYKRLLDEADFAGNTQSGGVTYVTGLDVHIIRLADVYLMAAECAAETGDLPYAQTMVNAVRERADNLPRKKINGSDAAAYSVEPYPASAFGSKDDALKAIRFERRLELALEGHRFFDLVRWGIAKEELETYSAFEGSLIEVYNGLSFSEKNNIFPIPQDQIDRSGGNLQQNPGY
ncbi:RagB/SusD family nutrient uptake outer membrane protein [Sinomicrobium pectinilyticum]|uniref:RagB/SusD family nutrient uptake outer membrane protein n=1 Tax=Sinomicrobium pectinilyticum TaxID=1084421 RepID=A0A3N0EYJ1_SINP1|nr:RagB/SusD family nutrient uptake outer membrane protein [Sinomicrobium pectinilyticum]RNL92970.1 RagB/SusD family nutrient uptake outer membrane protein [Sinomicrobium pectinilyticum]